MVLDWRRRDYIFENVSRDTVPFFTVDKESYMARQDL